MFTIERKALRNWAWERFGVPFREFHRPRVAEIHDGSLASGRAVTDDLSEPFKNHRAMPCI